MPTMIQTTSGKVTGLWGKAMIRGADGKMRPLQLGDFVVKGDVILTTQDGIVQLTPDAVPVARKGDLDDIEAPGAGAAGGSLLEGLRVGRIIEDTTASDFNQSTFFDVQRIGPSVNGSDLRPAAPVADPGALTVNEDSLLPIRLTGRDSDGIVTSFTITRVPTGGLLLKPNGDPVANGTTLTPVEAAGLTFVPSENFNGNPGSIEFFVTDDSNTPSAPATVSISVTPVNDPPVPGTVNEGADQVPVRDPSDNLIVIDGKGTKNYQYRTDEDVSVGGQVKATDVDRDTLTYSKASDPTHGTVTVNPDGTWRYTPAPDYNGPDSFVVTVDDGQGGTATSTVFIDVTPVNDPPEGKDATRSVPEGTPYVFDQGDFGFSDKDPGDTLAGVRIDTVPTKGSLTLNGEPVTPGTVVTAEQLSSGALKFVPTGDDNGSPYGSFTFSVQDPAGAFDTTPNTFSVNVTPLSNTPVAVDDVVRTPEDSPVVIDVLKNDSDADPEDTLKITEVNDTPIVVGGPPVTIRDPQGNPVGTVTLTPDNKLEFKPVPDYTGPAIFTYTVTDGLTPVKGTVDIDVTPVNDPPQANQDVTNTPEGQPVTIPVLANDSDPDGDPLTITQVDGKPITVGSPVTLTDPTSGEPVGTVALTPDGKLVFTPGPGITGPVTFPYTVTDPSGTPSTATVTVKVGEVNDTPVATPDTGSTDEDTALVVSAANGVIKGAAGTDTDPDGDSLTVNAVLFGSTVGTVGAPLAGAWGSLVLRPDGSYTYTPSAAAQALDTGESQSDVFTYTVTDPNGLTATTTLTITVTGVNDGPVAVDDRAITPENTPITLAVLSNDSDPEGDPLTITEVDGKPIAVGSPVTLTDPNTNTPIGVVALTPEGTLVFTPAPGFNGPIEFPYTVSDGTTTDTATVRLTVDSENDPPVAKPDNVSGPEDTTLTFDPRSNDADPEKDPLTITEINGQPISPTTPVTLPEGVVSMNPDGTLSFQPNPGFNGPLSFGYTVSDGELTDTSTVNIVVTAVNDPPEGKDATRTTPEGTPYTLEANDFGFSDPDVGDTLAGVRIDSLPTNGSLTLDGVPVTAGTVVTPAQIDAGALKFVPNANESGSPYGSFTFSVQDPDGAFDAVPNTFTLKVDPLSATPAVADDLAVTPEDTPVTIDVLANDSDADPEDKLVVTEVNDQPITVGGAPIPVTDAAGKPIGAVTLSPEGKLVFTPVPGYNGPASFTYTATDGLTPVKGNVDVTVTPVNDPPQANADVTNTPEGQPVTIPVLANDSDPDGDPLTITQVDGKPIAVGTPVTLTDPTSGEPVGTVSLTPDGKLVFTPEPGVTGPVTFPYTVTDPSGTPSTATVTVNVGEVNDTPVATPDTGSTDEDTTLVVSAANGVIKGAAGADTDPDGNSLTVNAISFGATTGTVGAPLAGAWGELVLRPDGSYTYTPSAAAQALDAGQSQTDVFTYTVTDPNGLTATTTLTITVTGVDDGPVAVDDSAKTPENTPVTVAVLANDSDPEGDPLTITEVDGKPIAVGTPVSLTDPVTGTPIGTVTLTPEGTLVFDPAPGFNGPVDFPYTVSDGTTTDTATVSIVVDSRNDPPVANPDVITSPQGTLVTFDPRANDADPEKDPLTITEVNGQPISEGNPVTLPEGVLSLNPDGTLSFQPNPGFNGPLTFGYTVSDGGLSDQSTVTINVVGNPPEGKDTTRSTPEDTPYTLEANDFGFSDRDVGDALKAVRIDSLPAKGSLQLDGAPVVAGTLVTAAQLAAGALKFVPDADQNGSPYGSFTFSVQDSAGSFDLAPNTFTLNVSPLSDTPVAADDVAITPEDVPVTIDVLANDTDADPLDKLTITAVNDKPITVGGDPIVVTDATGKPIGSVTLTPDSKLVFTPAPNYNGPATFTYTVTDGLTPVKGNVDVTVTPVNDPPQASPDVTNTPEDQPVTIAVLRNDSDPDGDPLKITEVAGKPITTDTPVDITDGQGTKVGTVTLTPTGELVFTPEPNFNGPVSFPYTITDPSGTPSTATVTVNVGEVNDAPAAAADTGTTDEDTTLAVGAAEGVVLGAAGRDTDPDGDSLTVSAVSFGSTAGTVGTALAGAWGELVLRPDGSYTYTPSAAAQALDDGQSRTDVFTYTVTDLGGLTATTTLTITVTGVNDGPVAVNDSASTPEDTPVTVAVLANDSDPDGDPLTITEVAGKPIAVGSPVALTDPNTNTPIGTVSLTPEGTLVFTPAPGFNGPVEFPYTVSDGTTTDTALVNLTVDSVNDPPVANPDVITGPEDTLLTFDPRSNDADPEKDPLTITEINGQPIALDKPITLPEGVVSLNPDGTLSFQPNPNFNGPLTFEYTVSDGQLTDTSTVSISISAVNDTPEGRDAVETTPEDTPYTLTVANFGFTDPDAGDSLKAVRIDALPGSGSLQLDGVAVKAGDLVTAEQITAGLLKFVPGANENGSPYGNFTFSVQDQSGTFDPQPNTFTLNVTPVSDTPAAGDDRATTPEDTAVFIDVLANDTDADPEDVLTISAVNGNPVTLGGPGVTVNGPNGLPIGTVELVTEAGKPQLKFTPVKDYNGPADFTYTVTDGLTPVNAKVSVTVTPVNDAPVANPDNVTTPEDTQVTITVLSNDTDVDNDALEVARFTAPTNGGSVVLNANGTFTYTPATNFTGVDTFTYTVKDPDGLESTTTVTVNVGGVNDAPVANPDTDTTNEDTTLVRAAGEGVIAGRPPLNGGADTDLDGNSLTVSAVAFKGVPGVVGQEIKGDWGSLTLDGNGGYRYVPNAAAQGLDDGESQIDQFSYTVTDGGLSSTTTLTITVTGVNDGPVAVDDSGTTREGTPVTVAVLANDTDADTEQLNVTEVNGQPISLTTPVDLFDNAPTPNKIGTVTLEANGSLTFTPVPLFNGPVEFTYTVSDGTATDQGLVKISVDNVNDPPDARDDPLTGTEDTPLNFNPLANDVDVDGDPLTITAINGTPIKLGDAPIDVGNGTIQMIPGDTPGTTQLQFVPDGNFNGVQTFQYTISDGRGGSDTATVSINVRPQNDTPEGKDAVETTPEDTPYTITVDNFGFTDADVGDSLKAVRIDTLPAKGTLQLDGVTLTGVTVVTAAQITAGLLKFVPAANENGTPYGSFTFSVQDQSDAFDLVPNTFTLNVEPVSDTPAAGDDRATTPEDTAVFIDVLANDTDNDPQDVLTITAVNGTPLTLGGAGVPVNGPAGTPIGTVELVTEAGKPQLKFTPVKDYNGPADFTYTVTDGLTPVNAKVSVTVTPVNDAPVANPDNVTTPEDTQVTITVLSNDTDVDNDALEVARFTAPTNGGSVVLNANGTFTYTPATNFTGVDTFTYTVKDPDGLESTTTVTVNVGGVNDAPVANPDTDTTNEDTTLVRAAGEGVIAGRPPLNGGADTDLDGNSLTVSAVAFKGVPGVVGQEIKGDWGSLTLDGNGGYRYVPNAAAQGLDDGESQIDQFSYTVTDGGLSSTTTLTITVTGVNDGPVAVDDSGTTREGTPVTVAVLANDTDADTEQLNVTEVNGQPISLTTPVDLFDNAPTPNKIGTVTLEANGSLTFTPVPLFNGPVEFTYTVSDGTATDQGLVKISVDNVNDPPDARDDPLTGTEDTPLNFNPLANDVDVDGDPLTITAINGTPIKLGDAPIDVGNGTIQMIPGDTPGTTQLQFVPDGNFNGVQTFQYTISDGRGGSDTATVSINVRPQNDTPEGKDAVETTPEDTPYTITVDNFGFTDADVGDSLKAVRIDTLPAKGTLQLDGVTLTGVTVVTAAQITAGLLKFVPAANENGTPYGSFTFSVQDQSDAFDLVPNTFTLNVEPVSDTPAAGDDRATTPEDTAVFIDVLANDTDNDPQDVLTITAVNGTPLTLGGAGVPVNGPAGTPIGTVELVTEAGKPQLKFTPVKDYNGPADFTYTVTDGLTPVNAKVSVTVTPVNDAPVANPDNVTTPEDTQVTITVLSNDTDVDNDALEVARFTAPTNGGSVVLNANGTFTYTPATNFTGVDTFTYTVKDPDGLESTTTVTVNVGGVNDAPVANPDTDTTNEDTTLVRAAGEGVIAGRPPLNGGADTDLDGNSLTVSAVAFKGVPGVVGQEIKGDWGSLTLDGNGGYRYVPNAAAQGLDDGESQIDQFSYTVTDGGLSSTTTLTITVTGVNDGPVAVDDSGTTREGTPVTVAVLANDTDADTEQLNVTEVNGQPISLTTPVDLFDNAPTPNKIGTVTLEANGSLTFTPVPLFNGPVEFTYTVSDGTATDQGLVKISVDNVNDPPDARDDPLTGTEDTPLNFNPLANDVDVDGDPLTITAINGTPIKLGDAPIDVGNGTIQMIPGDTPGTTQLQFVPDGNFNGVQTFQYTISDGRGGSDTATVSINVRPQNDTPEGKDAVETTPEDTPYTITVDNFGFTDADVGDSLKAVRIDTLPAKGTLQLDGVTLTGVTVVTAAQITAGLLKFVPAANENGTPYGSFTFSVQDQSDAFDLVPNTFTLNVEPVSDTPAAGDDRATTPEDTAVFIDVLANDTDNDPQDVLTITAVNGTPLTLGGAGVPVNGPAGTPIGTVELVTEAGKPQLKFTPVKDYNGPADFTYTVTDGLTPVNAKVSVTVTPVNDAPVANPDNVTTPEDTQVTITVLSNDTDVDNDALEVARFTAPTNGGSVVLNANGTFTYTPATNFTGVDTFTYTVKDPDGLESTTTVTVNVGGVNDAPVANPDTDTTNEDTTLVRAAGEGVIAGRPPLNGGADTDLDGNSLTVSAVAFKGVPGVVGQEIKGDWGSLTLDGNGGYRYVPNAAAQGLDDGESQIDQFSYTVTDGGLSSTTTLTITVTGVNDGPVAVDDSGTTREGTPVTVAVLANDTDADTEQLNVTEVNGQPISLTTPVDLFDNAPTPNKIGTVTLEANGSLTFTPVPLFNGPVEFTYTVSDGTATDQGLVKISVDNVNDPPDARDDPLTGTEDTPLNFNPLANDVDVDGDPLTITAINGTPIKLGDAPIDVGNGTIQMIPGDTPGTTQLQFVPDGNFNGVQTFQYTISDGRGGSDTATVSINVRPQNDTPEGKDAVETTPEDTPYTITVDNFGFTDADVGDSLKAVRIDTLPAKGTLQLDGVTLTGVTVVTAAQITAGLLKFVPAANENGTPYGSFTFSVQDQSDAFDLVPNTFTLNVEPVSDTPAAGDDRATTPEDTAVFIDVLANDTDNDPQDVLTITAVNGTPLTLGGAGVPVNGPAGTPIGTVELVTEAGKPQLKFTPVKDYNGPADFTYTVTDGLTPVNAKVSVTVTPVNDAPVANPDNVTTPEDTQVTITVLSNDTDVDNDALEVARFTAPTNGGSVVLNANGTFTYTPATNFTGVDTFTYTVKDPDGLESTTTVTVNVGGVNDAPVANPDTDTTNEDTTLVRAAGEGVIAGRPPLNGGADTDLDGNSLTVSAVAFKGVPGVVGQEIKGDWGSLTLDGNGGYRYVPNAAAQGLDDGESQIDQFSYTVTDGGLSSTTTLTITVTGVNDGPVAVDDSGTTREGTPVTVAVLANDTDADTEQLNVTEVNGQPISLTTPVDLFDNAPTPNKIGTVTLEANGSLTFTPVPLFNGPVEFTYTVSDGTATDQGLVKISVDNVNDPPDARDDPLTGTEDTPLNFNPLANDVDVDGDPLTITAINGTPIKLGDAPIDVGNGTIQMVPGDQPGTTQLQFVPDGNFNGVQTFQYTISDGRGGSDTATVTINVQPSNDPPEGADKSATTSEGSPYTMLVADFGFTDIDVGDSLKAVRVDTLPTNGTLQLDGVTLTGITLVTAAQITAGLLKFVPDAGENGTPYGSFTFSVQDQSNQFDLAPNTFTLNVNGELTVNSVPVEEGQVANFTVGIPGSDQPTLIKLATSTTDPTYSAEDADLALPLVVTYVNGTGQTITLTPALDGTYTVPAGVTSLSVGVPTVQDQVYEGPETFGLTATSTSPTVVNGDVGATGIGTIDDRNGPDSDLPVIGISVAPPTVDEDGTTNLVYTVAITNGKTSEFPTVVTFTLGGTATENTDYAPVTKSVTIPAGATSATFAVDPTSDPVYEGNETVVATLTRATTNGLDVPLNQGATTATGTIVDDGDLPIVEITVAPPTVDEEGATNLTYTVSLANGKTSAFDTTVTFTLGGTATEGTDYAPVTKTVTILAGQTTASFVVDPTSDQVFEGQETVVATLTEAITNGVTLGLSPTASVATGTIDDENGPDSDKPIVRIDVAPPTVDEDGAANLTYTVSIANGKTSAFDTTVTFTLGGTATEGTDFAPVTRTVTIPAGQTSVNFVVDPTTDEVFEGNETVVATLATATTNGVALQLSPAGSVATGSITDDADKPIVEISVAPATVNEEGAVNLTYTVALANGKTSAFDTTVTFTLGGTATEGTDYAPVTRTVTIPAGQASVTFDVDPTDDQVFEGLETVVATLTAAITNGVTLGLNPTASVATGTIDDVNGPDSDKPIVGITVNPATVNEEGATNLTYTVSLVNGKTSATPTTVTFTLGGTAIEGTDYAPVTKTVTIPAGQTSVTFDVDPTDDQVLEGLETVVATLTSATTNGVTLALSPTATVATGTIDDINGPDSDKPIVRIDVAPPTVAEDGAANLTYTVSIANGKTSATPTTVTFTLGGTATEGTDYAPVSRTVTIPAGQTSVTFDVDPATDAFFERNETVIATLTDAITNGITLGIDPTGTSATGTIIDNDSPTQGTVPVAQEAALPEGTDPGLTTEVVSGTMAGTDTGNPSFAWTLGAPAPGSITAGGVAVVWTVSADGKTVTGTVPTTVGGLPVDKPVATLTIDDNGDYTFTLQSAIDHPAGGGAGQVLPIQFTATANTGDVSASAPLTINVQDDQPGNLTPPEGLTSTIANTNLLFVLDISGSMNQASGIGSLTRLQAAVDSIDRLIQKYDALGETTVRLVTFNNAAAARDGNGFANLFLNLADPGQKQALTDLLASIRNNPPPNNANTNYDAALATAITAWGAGGKITGAQNVSYFLSDGLPTAGQGSNTSLTGGFNQTGSDLGIQAQEEATWTNFLVGQNLQSYAIGIGTGITTGAAALAPVAYDGQAQENRNGQIVTDFAQLDNVLASTLPDPIQGNLVGSLTSGGAGADGGIYVKNVVISGVTYEFTRAANGVGGTLSQPGTLPANATFDAATGVLTVVNTATTGGTVVIDFDDGSYRFESPRLVGTEAIGYALADRDGDVTTPATLQILVDTPTPAVNDTGAGTLLTGDEKFNTIYGNAGDDTLVGLGGNDKLFGNAGNDNLNGGTGNDELSGGAGNDIVDGAAGDDFVAGGAGNDTLTGGLGSDVFAWRFADQGSAGAGRALDTITDFDVAPVAQGGDVLDLRDLLVGEIKGAGDTVGTLQNYLDIQVVGGNTEIRVSTSGGFTGGNYGTGAAEDQRITLTGVNLSTSLVPGQTLNEAQIIENLLKAGKLITD